MKKFLKGISAFLALAMISVSAGCDNTPEETTATDDPALTAVTDESGTPVTDEEGNVLYTPNGEEMTVGYQIATDPGNVEFLLQKVQHHPR